MLAAADNTIRDLRKEMDEKTVEAEKEVADLQAALETATTFLGIASNVRAGFLTHIKAMIKMAEELPSQDVVLKAKLKAAVRPLESQVGQAAAATAPLHKAAPIRKEGAAFAKATDTDMPPPPPPQRSRLEGETLGRGQMVSPWGCPSTSLGQA